MALEKVKIRVGDLKLGMFVSDLDRPWLDTPFPFQGFAIGKGDISRIAQYCEYVYIDVNKSIDTQEAPRTISAALPKSSGVLFDKKKVVHYERESTRDEELKTARPVYNRVTDAYDHLIDDLASNRKINIPQLKDAIVPMVDSVVRNPDAFILLTQLKHLDSYAYQHAMSCAVLAVATGRHIGLPKTMLNDLALGAALFDLGRARLSHELLAKPRVLSEEEMDEIRKHVDYSLEIVLKSGHLAPDAMRMIETHHERYDGSGYPQQLVGDQIPLFGRIAGIVDSYDAITSPRPHAKPMTPDEAIRMLYEWRDVEFQGALIEQFIQVIGVYPVGTIVELSDGRVGIVVAQHLEARLRPVVMILMEGDKQFINDYYEFDLREHTTGQDGQKLKVTHSLAPGAYGIEPSEYFV